MTSGSMYGVGGPKYCTMWHQKKWWKERGGKRKGDPIEGTFGKWAINMVYILVLHDDSRGIHILALEVELDMI